MSIATSTAIGIAGAVGAAGAIGGSALGASAAGNAASTQANAANQAAALQYQESQNALAQQQQEFNIGQTNLAPWLSQGRAALGQLSYLMGLPTGGPTSGTAGVPATGTATLSDGSTFVPGGIGNPNGGGEGPPRNVGSRAIAYEGDQNGNGPNTSGDIMQPGTYQGSPGTSPQMFNPNASISSGGTAAANPNDLSQYVNPSLGASGSLLAPYPGGQFAAPTDVTEQNDPGYQFRLQQAQQALEHSAAAKGDIFSGGTAQQENQLAQDYASNEYGNVYNRALNTYQTNYNAYQQQQANTYNRLAGVAGTGQTAAQQLTAAGLQNAAQVGNIDLTTGAQIGSDIQNAGAARASGYAAAGNLYGGALSSGTNGLLNLYMMQQLLNGPANAVNNAFGNYQP